MVSIEEATATETATGARPRLRGSPERRLPARSFRSRTARRRPVRVAQQLLVAAAASAAAARRRLWRRPRRLCWGARSERATQGPRPGRQGGSRAAAVCGEGGARPRASLTAGRAVRSPRRRPPGEPLGEEAGANAKTNKPWDQNQVFKEVPEKKSLFCGNYPRTSARKGVFHFLEFPVNVSMLFCVCAFERKKFKL